jgi:hypothetical protein
MKNRALFFVILANLVVLVTLLFVYPHLTISPGKLIDGHEKRETDCFACHSSWRGTPSAKCVECHKVDSIGVTTTTGAPIREKTMLSGNFHRGLLKQDCAACHSDHLGVKPYREGIRFSHALLEKPVRERCDNCHRKPTDSLHRDAGAACSRCHSTERWTPATFDHDEYFQLDHEHNVKCTTCHEDKDFRRYTCYGCHEHSLGRIRSKHVKEGISDYEKCTECHRSADEHDIRGRGGRSGKHGGDRKHEREHDD